MPSISTHVRSNIVGYIAVFLALSGVTYAAGLKPNSVKSKHIKNGQVRTADLASGAVTAAQVASNSLGGAQVDESSLDPGILQQRITGTCPEGESIRSVDPIGGVTCEVDDAGTGGGTGTVTRVDTGTGLSGGPITTTGTASIAAPYRLPQACTNGQVAKSNGAGVWNCAADSSGGAPSGAAGGDLTGTYPNPLVAANAVGTSEVTDNSLTGNDINESTLVIPSTDAYYVDGGPGQQFGIVANETRQVESVTLPAGKYTLAANLGLAGVQGDIVKCWFTSTGADQIGHNWHTFGGPPGFESLALVSAVSLNAAGSVGVVCQSGAASAGSIFFDYWSLVATKVANLTRQ